MNISIKIERHLVFWYSKKTYQYKDNAKHFPNLQYFDMKHSFILNQHDNLPTEQPINERINSMGRSHSSRFSSFESCGFVWNNYIIGKTNHYWSHTSSDCWLLFLVGTKFRNRSNMIRQLCWNGNHVGIFIIHIHDLIYAISINIFIDKEHVVL